MKTTRILKISLSCLVSLCFLITGCGSSGSQTTPAHEPWLSSGPIPSVPSIVAEAHYFSSNGDTSFVTINIPTSSVEAGCKDIYYGNSPLLYDAVHSEPTLGLTYHLPNAVEDPANLSLQCRNGERRAVFEGRINRGETLVATVVRSDHRLVIIVELPEGSNPIVAFYVPQEEFLRGIPGPENVTFILDNIHFLGASTLQRFLQLNFLPFTFEEAGFKQVLFNFHITEIIYTSGGAHEEGPGFDLAP